MCEYCSKENTEGNLVGEDGVICKDGKHYLYIEYFLGEKYYIEVNYCPECGRELEN